MVASNCWVHFLSVESTAETDSRIVKDANTVIYASTYDDVNVYPRP